MLSGRSRLFLIAFLVLVLVAGLASGCKKKSVEPILFGGVSPLTGTVAKGGQSMKNAADLAVEEINAAGGINGRPIQLNWEDDEGVPNKSVSVVEKLVVGDGVVVTIGPFNSACGLANLEVSQREKCPQIVPVAFTSAITRPAKEYVFRNIPQAEHVGRMVGNAWYDLHPVKTWAIIHENTDLGRDYLRFFTQAIESKGAGVIATEVFNLGDTDMYAQLTKLRGRNPEAVILISNITEAAQILRQADDLNFRPIWFASGSQGTYDFWNLAGELANGLYSLSFFEPGTDRPVAKAFVDAFKAKYGQPPDMYAAATYDAVYIAADAVKRAGTDFKDLATWRMAIRDALEATDALPGVQGDVTFNEYHECPCTIYILQWDNGVKKIISSAEPPK
jgi:branched-chain amino acid transport system substrate-binding protein